MFLLLLDLLLELRDILIELPFPIEYLPLFAFVEFVRGFPRVVNLLRHLQLLPEVALNPA